MEVEEKESRSNEEYNQRDSREEESLEKDLIFFVYFLPVKHSFFITPSSSLPHLLSVSRGPQPP